MTVDLLIFGRVNSLTVLNLCFYPELKQLYQSQFRQKWQSDVNTSSKWFCYRIDKTDHTFEKYFDIIDGKLLRSFVNFIRFTYRKRCSPKMYSYVILMKQVMSVIVLLNVLFSLKIEVQFYLQDDVETQIMYTVHKIKPQTLCKFMSIILYHVNNPPHYLFFSLIVSCFIFLLLFFLNRSITKSFVIMNYFFPYHYHSVTQTAWCMLCLFLLISYLYIC